jgi:hypothetical protein
MAAVSKCPQRDSPQAVTNTIRVSNMNHNAIGQSASQIVGLINDQQGVWAVTAYQRQYQNGYRSIEPQMV